VTEPATTSYAAEDLRRFTTEVFESLGVPSDEAALAADVLIAADLRGIESHGVARLDAYVGMLGAGHINPTPQVKVVRESPSTATVDGDNGLGLVVGPKANRIAIEKASEVGTGWVSVRNTNHYGIAGWYVLRAIEAGMIGWSMTNSTAIVAPLWGRTAMLGTNPIAIGWPAGEEPPVVLDMATSAVAFGKIEIAARRGDPIPEGWAIGKDGEPALQTSDFRALLPLGSTREMGGHKGYGLASVVDMLCALLSGANWGPFAPPFSLGFPEPERYPGVGIGHFLGAMDIGAFIEPAEFAAQADDWIRTLRSTPPAPGTDGPLIPGDPEREAEVRRAVEGIPLLTPVVDSLAAVSTQTGVVMPSAL
jgi:LDH2 family malate/lactate/ureidoglycolate dehydrogenase